MQKVLRKRIFRDFKENLPRYLALAFLLILSMYMVVSIVGAAETVMRGTTTEAKKQNVEDGQFSLFVPMKESEWDALTDKGITLEKMFFLDYAVDGDKTIRVFRNRTEINTIAICAGKLAQADDELVLERQYAEKNAIHVGDTIVLGDRTYKVSGIGTVPDYDSPLKSLSDTSCDSLNFGLAFVTDEVYTTLQKEGKSAKSEEYYYAYKLNDAMTDDELKAELKKLSFSSDDVDDVYFQEYWDRTLGREEEFRDGINELADGAKELAEGLSELTDNNPALQNAADGASDVQDGMQELKDETEDMLDEIFTADADNLLSFVAAEDNVRIHAAGDDVAMNKTIGMIAGVLLLVLIAYVLSVFVVHSIDQESAVIGALYALGVKRKDLMKHYILLPTLISLIGGAIGTALAYTRIGVWYQMQDAYNYYSLPDALQSQINPHFLYNTLESITWMVEAQKNKEAVFMISELARLLRISLSKGRTVIRIADELQHSRSYMNIQLVRYKERFRVEFDIDEEVNDYCTVKLIVQPILENAIYYGVGNMDEDDGGMITVRGEKKGDDIYLSVEDNGMGMSEETVENVLKDNNKVPKHGSGVGLINVHNRIQLMFGNEYGLLVYSEPDEGTKIVIHIPAIPFTEENRQQLEAQSYRNGRATDETR